MIDIRYSSIDVKVVLKGKWNSEEASLLYISAWLSAVFDSFSTGNSPRATSTLQLENICAVK
jgi:hypothetical protein